VPYNIFSDGGVTQAALDYLETLGTASGSTELRTFHADTTGDLGVYGLKLPTANDGVGVNVGYEYRRERVRYLPDAAYESGLIVGTGGAYPRIDNALSVKEGFAEVRAPLVQGKPGVHELLIDTGYRYSDYSTGVTTDTYKFELQYAPVAHPASSSCTCRSWWARSPSARIPAHRARPPASPPSRLPSASTRA